jgi:hypothetical protein
LFVKETSLENAEWLEEVLNQEVVVVGFGWLKVGVARRNALGTGVGIDDGRRDKISDIGPGYALTKVGA